MHGREERLERVFAGITAGDTYETPPSSARWPAGRFPSLAFHLKMLGIYGRAGLSAVLGRYTGRHWSASSLSVVRALESVGVRFRIENLGVLERLPGPVVFVANHMSTLETFVLPCLIQPRQDLTFVVKESLVRIPVFGPVLRSRRPVVVGRKDPRRDLKTVLEGGTSRLREGTSIIVFPQTTRSAVFDPSRFNTIGVKLAARAGVFAVPVALKTDAWGVGRLVKDFGPIDPEKTVRIRFGEPMSVEGSGREAHGEIVRFISGCLREWEGEGEE